MKITYWILIGLLYLGMVGCLLLAPILMLFGETKGSVSTDVRETEI